ncbi:MAG: asparagine synthase (glutamine-hydrolyzing) [Rhodospirillaceae bacterium]|nr:asparagine synthase (glutamine-hydrolyzing) [Rhodospirillaceae bacterium]
MCGIAGYTGAEIEGLLDGMIEAIAPRGPDGEGRFEATGVHFGHTRLAIIDLANGDQPMVVENGRLAVTYNGEIYNYIELRQAIEAKGYRFRTNCDTEVIPLGYAAFGPDFFARLNGIFAFALWDRDSGEIFLVRDHFGVKPLYYGVLGGELAFSSCARAIAHHPAIDRRLRPDGLREYLQFRYVPSGRHFYEGVETLPPGHMARWRDGRLELTCYWRPRDRMNGDGLSRDEWVRRTSELLEDSVALQLRSDVPVGVFLSGGVDSATIMHFAARHTNEELAAYTFSVGDDVDEVVQAAVIAGRYGGRHVKVAMNGEDDFAGFYDAIACMALPVGDAIILPTYELCRAAARERKVVLTGEGADEVFGGYVHYPVLTKLDRLSRRMAWMRHFAPLVPFVPVAVLDRFFDYQASLGVLGRRKVAAMIGALGDRGQLQRLVGAAIDDDAVGEATTLGPPPPAGDADLSLPAVIRDGIATWLPYQILNKMDQLSMAHGLEARVPYLDPRLFDLVADAPDDLILDNGENKVLLREVMRAAKVANADRRKIAFHLPMETVYRDRLVAMCREWLAPEVTARHGILRQPFIDRGLKLLDQGEFIASKQLVAMVGLHMWLDAHGGTL